MRLLLDTHIALWWVNGDSTISEKAIELIADESNLCFFSAASVWEIEIKASVGKLSVPESFYAEICKQAFIELPVSHAHAQTLRKLPVLHKDPFDRMLVAQAVVENLTLLTADRRIAQYPVSTLLT